MISAHKNVLSVLLPLFLLVVAITSIFTVLQKQSDPRSRAQDVPSPTQSPSIILTTPTTGTTVSGTSVILTAQANFPVGHHGVEFFFDGNFLGASSTLPYTITWDTTNALNGSHTIIAKKVNEDQPDQAVSSQPITIIVANAVNDNTPPTISAVTAHTIQSNFVIISWITNEKTTAQVLYGKTTPTLSTTMETVLMSNHSQQLTNLESSTQYTYRVKSKDAAGNETLSDAFTFTTRPESSSTVGELSSLKTWPLSVVHATLLYTGDVFVWGRDTATKKTHLWNPTGETFTSIPVSANLFCSGHATLSDGRVYAAGGHIDDHVGIKNTTIFNPTTKIWSTGPAMTSGRWYPSLNIVSEDKMVILSGEISSGKFIDTPEMYNPISNTLSPLSSIKTTQLRAGGSGYSLTFLLPTGKLLTIGQKDGSTQLLDTLSQTWVSIAKSPIAGGSGSQFLPGKILLTGGYRSVVIDMNAPNPNWRLVAPMKFPRFNHNLVNLPDGKVLAIGGSETAETSAKNGPLPIEIWDPINETWTTHAPLNIRRMYHSTAILLPDGRILAAGGWNGSTNNATAEIYSPSYLFKGARPTITSIPSSVSLDETVILQTPDAANIAKIALIAPASQTHTLDMNQRYTPLTFTKGTNKLTIHFPSNANITPPGYYMLFIINTNGAPSIAKMIKIIRPASTTSTPTVPASPTLTPSPTNTPTGLPTLTISPSATLTSSSPPPSVTSTQSEPTEKPSLTPFSIKVYLHGIGKGGDSPSPLSNGNMNPMRTSRTITIQIINNTNGLVGSTSGTIMYHPDEGNYHGILSLGDLASGSYRVKAIVPNYLQKFFAGIITITGRQQNILPPVTLTTGDNNNDNLLSILDYNIIMDCYSDTSPARNCNPDKKLQADITDDGSVNQLDYNLFIRELSVIYGE